jgi:hypothetical protein
MVQPEIGIPLALSYLTGVPVLPSPQAIATAVVEDGAPILNQIGEPIPNGGTPEETMTLFRGVNENHTGYGVALEGTALPRGGSASPLEHNLGNTESEFTSWTTNREVAVNYALRPKGTGVVLQTTVPNSSTTPSPSLKNVLLKQSGHVVNETEVLLKGAIYGTTITTP